MSESGVKNAVAQRVVRPHELQQWHRNWNGTPNRKVLRQHNIETAIEYLPRPRQWLSPLSASPAKMRAFYSGDDNQRATVSPQYWPFPASPGHRAANQKDREFVASSFGSPNRIRTADLLVNNRRLQSL